MSINWLVVESTLWYLASILTAVVSAFNVLVVSLTGQNINREIRRRYLLYACALTFWSANVFIFSFVRDQRISYLCNQLLHFGAIFIPVFLLDFVLSFFNIRTKRNMTELYIVYVLSISVAVIDLFFPSYFSPEVIPKRNYPYFLEPGVIYGWWVALFSYIVLSAHVKVLSCYFRTHGEERKRLGFFLFPSLIAYTGCVAYFLPVYDVFIFPYPWGCFGAMILSSALLYGILRKKLLGVDVFLRKTIVFAGISFFVFALFFIPMFLLPNFLHDEFTGQYRIWLLAFAGMVVAAAVGPLNQFLVNVTDRYLFQKKVNYRQLLKEATEYLAHLKSLRRQARRIVIFLAYKARIANVSLYAYQSFAPGSLLLQARFPKVIINGHKTIALSHPLANFLNAHRSPLELHSIEAERSEESNPAKLKEFDEILQLFKEHNAEAIIPCFGSAAVELARRTRLHLRGILFLGHQKSDQPYSEEDLDVFFTLGQESSIAFENARLFDEAKTRAVELAKANEDLRFTNAELIRLNEKLKEVQTELMETKHRALVAGMGRAIAHEINNPLSSVMTPIQNVQKSIDELQALHEACESSPTERNRRSFFVKLETIKEGLARAKGGADRIKGIIGTLGDLVKTRTDEKKPVQLKLIVKCAWEEVKYQTYYETMGGPESYGLAIPHDLPYVRGIAHDLQGVFVNLFTNALHALEHRQRDKKIDVEASMDPDNPEMLRIEFSDNGSGMMPEVLAKCFEQGYTTKGKKGTGIGLHYVKYVIEQHHGGTIDVKSEVGVGTTFIIRLPRYKEEEK